MKQKFQSSENDIICDEIKIIVDKIKDELYFSDEDIEKDLKLQLEKLDDEKRQEQIQNLHATLSETFLNRPYFQQIYSNKQTSSKNIHTDYQSKYQGHLKQKQFDLIIEDLKNEQYCIANLIPQQINNYIFALEKLEKLKTDIHLIFELIEIVKKKDHYNILSTLKVLIQLFFIECENDVKGVIHQLIGYLLENFVYKFEDFELQVMKQNQLQFCHFQTCIQQVQLQDVTVDQGKVNLVNKCDNASIVFFFELFTQKLGSHQNNLIGIMKNLINAKNLNKEDLIIFVSMTENFDDNLDLLFFQLIFYYWVQFIEKFEIKQHIEMLEKKISKTQKKKELLENFIQHLNSKSSNIIYIYLINKILYYRNLQNDEFNQNFKQWQIQELEVIKNYDELISYDMKQLLDSQLIQFQNTIKQMMFYQISKSKQKQYQLLHFSTFLATNNLDYNSILILKNIIEQKGKLKYSQLGQIKKLQKINLLHIEQVLKNKEQIKMSKFVHQIEIFRNYPNQLNIQMEDFNISLISQQEIQENVSDWLRNKSDKEKFKKLLPYYFNIIKRGESPEFLLELINTKVINNQSNQMETLNLKSLFQILYNNSDQELQVMLLKLHSKNYPVPLLYQNPQLVNITSILDFYVLNEKIFYLLSNDFTIINFSLSRQQNQFGKTELINMIFYNDYKDHKFEIRDSSQINNNSIDCQFDFSFNGSRNYLIGDVHGKLEDEILGRMLPFFKLWIIQMQTDDEFEENLNKSIELFEKMDQENKPKIIIIVRDSQKKQLNLTKIYNLQLKLYIHVYQILNLQKQDNRAYQKDEITKIKEFILKIIDDHNQKVDEDQISNSFLKMCTTFNTKDEEIQKCQNILKRLKNELKEVSEGPDGFYSIEAFPFRHLAWSMQSLKIERQNLNQKLTSYEQEQEKKQNAINDLSIQNNRELENKIKQKEQEMQEIITKIQQTQQMLAKNTNNINKVEEIKKSGNFPASNLIKLFDEVFNEEKFYVVYLGFVENIAKFCKKKLIILNKEIENIKQHKKGKEVTSLEKENLESQLKNLEQKCLNLNISIELFWREVIKGNKSFKNSVNSIVCKLIKKGEPFEFLSGCDFSIESEFLHQLREQLLHQKDKVLILSVLGPQSSGKSTLLNRIFGCHFLTNIGRCTKGLYLQLLKISNKKQFQDLFDYILILDSEGLQNPNQQDTEFDKRISLFLISISDILIFNVKGEIHSTFHNLIQVCFYTLSKFSKEECLKQFTWCYNQNNQVNQDEKYKFFKQIKDIGGQLNIEKNTVDEKDKGIDYKKYLDIEKDNLYILGMATVSQEWQKYSSQKQNLQQTQEIKQDINQQDYSKNALSFGKDIIGKFINKYQLTKQTNNEILTWTAFINKVQQYWEIVSKLPDLVEFSDLKEQKDYEIIITLLKENMSNINKDLQEFDVIFQEIEAESKQINSFQDYDQLGQQFSKQFLQKCKKKKEEVQESLQKEYSYSIISQTILLKIEGKIERVFNNIIKNSLIIKEISYNIVPKQIFEEAQQIKKNNNQQQKNLPNKMELDQIFDKLWEKSIKSSNQQIENLHKEFQTKLFGCFQKYQKHICIKQVNLDEQIEYFAININKLDPKKHKQNEMQQICQFFIPEFQQNSFQPINRQSKLELLQIFDSKIEKRLQDIPNPSFIDPKIYLEEITTYKVLEIQEIINELKKNLKEVLIKISKQNKEIYQIKAEIKELFLALQKLPIYINQQFLDRILTTVDQGIQNFPKLVQQNRSLSTQFQIYFHQQQSKKFHIPEQQSEKIHIPQQQSEKIHIPQQQSEKIHIPQQQSEKIYIPQQQRPQIIKQTSIQNIDQTSLSASIDNLIDQLQNKQQIPNSINRCILSQIFEKFPNLRGLVKQKKTMTDQEKNNYFIVNQDKEIIYKQSNLKPQLKIFFDYIISQKTYQSDQKEFFDQFPELFKEIVTENQGWEKLCSNIYDIIYQQFDQQQSKEADYFHHSFDIISMTEDMTQYKGFLEPIINNVDKFIETINKQLAFFGAQFSQIFIRKLQFYSFFLVWRFICYDKLKIYDKEQSILKENKGKMKQSFVEIILQTEKGRIQNLAKQQAKQIYNDCIKHFYNQNTKNAIKFFNSFEKTLFELIKVLDQQLLNCVQTKYHNKDQIYNYLSNQKEYIKGYVDSYIKTVQDDLKKKFIVKSFVNGYLNQIEKNASIVQKQIKKLNIPQNQIILDIFLKNELNQNKFELLQLNQILQFILGQNVVFKLLTPKIKIPFLEQFISEIQNLCEQCQKLETETSQFQLTGRFQEIKNIMNGCDKSCPMCRRKCDSQNYQEKDHRHKCSNGHQLRGMTGVLIRSAPSLFTCEEILDEAEIQMQENRQFKTWKEIKKIYYDWSFKDILLTEKLQENKLKFIEIWNGGVGELVCSKLQSQLNQKVNYQKKHDFPMYLLHHSIHYIFILDYSGSMQANWNSVIKCVKSQFEEIRQKDNARVSVILFNDKANIVINCEIIQIEEHLKLLIYEGGNTDFGPAFQATLQLLQQNPEYNYSVILFYTDGLAYYPEEVMKQFKNFKQQIKDSIYFLACSQPHKNSSLEFILEAFKNNCAYAEWRDKIEPSELNKNWTEMISQTDLKKYKA